MERTIFQLGFSLKLRLRHRTLKSARIRGSLFDRRSRRWVSSEMQNSAIVGSLSRARWESNGDRSSFFHRARFYVRVYVSCRLHTRRPRLDNTWRENVFGAVAVDVVRSHGLDGIDRRLLEMPEREAAGLSAFAPGSPGNCLCDSAFARPSRVHTLTRVRAYTRAAGAWQKSKTKFILRTGGALIELVGFPSVHAQFSPSFSRSLWNTIFEIHPWSLPPRIFNLSAETLYLITVANNLKNWKFRFQKLSGYEASVSFRKNSVNH